MQLYDDDDQYTNRLNCVRGRRKAQVAVGMCIILISSMYVHHHRMLQRQRQWQWQWQGHHRHQVMVNPMRQTVATTVMVVVMGWL
jgi:GT2 family glycosyltransferase